MSRPLPAALLAALLICTPASAAPAPTGAALLLARNGETVSLQQAVRRVEQRTDGRVLAARTVRRPDGTVHLIRVLVGKGRVRVFTVDAGTGEIR